MNHDQPNELGLFTHLLLAVDLMNNAELQQLEFRIAARRSVTAKIGPPALYSPDSDQTPRQPIAPLSRQF
jgi:hypothetical protein